MRKKIKIWYAKWLDWRIMSKESQIINTEEKRLKLISKKAKVTGSDKTAGVLANARLRFAKYKQREFESTEEKVNYTYSRIKYNPVTGFFRTVFSFTRKYRFMTGFLGYFSLIVSAIQTGTVFIFSSAFAIISLPFSLISYIFVALPIRIRTKRMCRSFLNSKKEISLVIIDGIPYSKLEDGYPLQLFEYLSTKGLCLVTSSNFSDNFSAVKKVSPNVYVCSHRFITYLTKRMDKKEFSHLIKI